MNAVRQAHQPEEFLEILMEKWTVGERNPPGDCVHIEIRRLSMRQIWNCRYGVLPVKAARHSLQPENPWKF